MQFWPSNHKRQESPKTSHTKDKSMSRFFLQKTRGDLIILHLALFYVSRPRIAFILGRREYVVIMGVVGLKLLGQLTESETVWNNWVHLSRITTKFAEESGRQKTNLFLLALLVIVELLLALALVLVGLQTLRNNDSISERPYSAEVQRKSSLSP